MYDINHDIHFIPTSLTCWDNLPMELRHLIFKFKRLNHFKQRMQSLSVSLENQKAIQHDAIVNMFINQKIATWKLIKCHNNESLKINTY